MTIKINDMLRTHWTKCALERLFRRMHSLMEFQLLPPVKCRWAPATLEQSLIVMCNLVIVEGLPTLECFGAAIAFERPVKSVDELNVIGQGSSCLEFCSADTTLVLSGTSIRMYIPHVALHNSRVFQN